MKTYVYSFYEHKKMELFTPTQLQSQVWNATHYIPEEIVLNILNHLDEITSESLALVSIVFSVHVHAIHNDYRYWKNKLV